MKKLSLFMVAIGLFIGTVPASANEGWNLRLTPYMWFAGLKGNISTIPGLPSAPVEVSPSDAVKDTQVSVMVMLDAKKRQHGFFLDMLYSDVESEEELIPPPIDLMMTSTTKTAIITLGYQFNVYNESQATLDLLAGARYWSVDTTLRFGGGLGALAGQTVRNDDSWIDPAVGIKGLIPLGSSRFYLAGGAGLGGFGVGSDRFHEVNVNIGYQWSSAIGTTFGYRLFDVDYENDGYVYDVNQQGWQLSLNWAI